MIKRFCGRTWLWAGLVLCICGGVHSLGQWDGDIQPTMNGVCKMDDNLTFAEAMKALAEGEKLARRAWAGEGIWIELVRGDPPLRLTCEGGAIIEWYLSAADVMTADYYIVQ